jgi:hypothetical protein
MPILPDRLIRHGLAVRTQIAAALEAQDAYLAALEEYDDDATRPTSTEPVADPRYPPVNGCAHPAAKRQDTTTAGGSAPSFFCAGCRHTSEEISALVPKVGG